MKCHHPLGQGVQANGNQASLGEQTLYAQSYETVFISDIGVKSVAGLSFVLWYAVTHVTWQLEWADQNMGTSHRRPCRRVLSLANSPVQVRRPVYAVTCKPLESNLCCKNILNRAFLIVPGVSDVRLGH